MKALRGLVRHQHAEVNTRLETLDAIDAIVKKVEASVSAETHKEHEGQLVAAARLVRHFAVKVKKLEHENEDLANQMITLRNGAQAVREKFAIDMGRMLSESKDMVDSKAAMKQLRLDVRDQRKQNKTHRNKEKHMQGEIEQLKNKIESMEQEMINREQEMEEHKESKSATSQSSYNGLTEESRSKEDMSSAKSAVDEVDSFFSELSSNSATLERQSVLVAEATPNVPRSNPSSPKQSTRSTGEQRKPCILSDLEDTELLEILTFLDTGEVLAAAQANRFIFTRVDEMFSLESKIAKPHWKIKQRESSPNLGSAEQGGTRDERSAAGSPSDTPDSDILEPQQQQQQQNAVQNFFTSLTSTLTNQINAAGALDDVDPELCILPQPVLDLLRTKLTAAEMKAISNLNHVADMNVKKTEELMTEKEDILQRLSNTETVRDFLISKLKSAEKALKSSIKEISGCRKQAAADGEVIHFLDTRGIELDARVKELEAKRQGLQTAYDLYRSTHSHNERQLGDQVLALKAAQMQGELSHKAEKKLLVKEIKTLRASLEKASNDRHVYAAQLRSVTQALKIGTPSSNSDTLIRSSSSSTRRRGSRENMM